MKRSRNAPQNLPVPGRLPEIQTDEDFEAMLPPLAPDERERKLASLMLYDCLETLVVWPHKRKQLLLLGYDVWPLLREYRIPFRIIKKEFANHGQARLFVVQELLGRTNLTALHITYLRGMYYQEEKEPHGGDRRSQEYKKRRWEGWLTVEALGEIYDVSPATLKRAGEVTRAVNMIADNCGGPWLKGLLLSHQARMTASGVVALAEKDVEEQRQLILLLQINGRLPRGWRNGGESATITLPRELQAMVHKLAKVLTVEEKKTFTDLWNDKMAEEEQAEL
jgi:hypothetical protein